MRALGSKFESVGGLKPKVSVRPGLPNCKIARGPDIFHQSRHRSHLLQTNLHFLYPYLPFSTLIDLTIATMDSYTPAQKDTADGGKLIFEGIESISTD